MMENVIKEIAEPGEICFNRETGIYHTGTLSKKRQRVVGDDMLTEQDIEFNPALQRKLMQDAVDTFNRNEQYLLKNRVNERCMCQRLAEYLGRGLAGTQYVVDVEYNRGMNGNESSEKRLDGKCVSLDIVVHKREYDADGRGFSNLICAEMKKASNPKGCTEDEERLRKLTDCAYGFCYQAGFMLLADDVSDKKELSIKAVFQDGCQIEE